MPEKYFHTMCEKVLTYHTKGGILFTETRNTTHRKENKMTRNRLRTVLETMAVKASIANICKAEGTYSQNFRECPFWSELKGMEQALKIFGIETVYSFNADTSRITGIEADGIYIEVV